MSRTLFFASLLGAIALCSTAQAAEPTTKVPITNAALTSSSATLDDATQVAYRPRYGYNNRGYYYNSPRYYNYGYRYPYYNNYYNNYYRGYYYPRYYGTPRFGYYDNGYREGVRIGRFRFNW